MIVGGGIPAQLRPAKCYAPGVMPEIGIAILVIGVLVVADPDRLQTLIDKLHDLMTWLAE